MTGTPNAKAGRAEKGSWVLVGHHEGRMCLMHSTHLMVKFFGFLRFFGGRGELGGLSCRMQKNSTVWPMTLPQGER